MSSKKPDISIIVTAHHEGLLSHKTMRSIERAIKPLEKGGYSYEIIVSIDYGDDITIDYFKNYTTLPVTIIQGKYRDLSASRNAAIKEARGKFISLIDADDLMTKNWLVKSLDFLTKQPYGKYVAHAEYTIEFEGADSIVKKYGATNFDQDILLSVYAGRWNSVIVTPKTLLQTPEYLPNSPGYGAEDWHMSLNFLQKKAINQLMPGTAIFVRRKAIGSEWERQKSNRLLLHRHPLFIPSNFKKLDLSKVNAPRTEERREIKNNIKSLLMQYHIPVGLVKKPVSLVRKVKLKLIRPSAQTPSQKIIPHWLEKEWHELHKLEKHIFPPSPLPPVYHTITDDHYRVGLTYWEICQHLRHDDYDYLLFVPWLKKGGADLFAINYANTAAELGNKVLVVATNEGPHNSSPWKEKLSNEVDFIDFGTLTSFFPTDQKYRLLEQLVENTNTPIIHIINSELGYDFARDHEPYIKATGKKIIATSYSQSTDDSKRIFGFSHTHVPQVYPLLSQLTTDNEVVKKMWIDEYAFDKSKIKVHHQPHSLPTFSRPDEASRQKKVLWASRLNPEKIPHLVSKIDALLPDDISIDMYGEPSTEISKNSLGQTPTLKYKGKFDGMYSLPLSDYGVYLYTSLFDGMPNAPIEVALAGVPIVASGVGGVPDFIEDNGIIINNLQDPQEYADAIVKIFSNYEEYAKKAQKLKEKAQKTYSKESFTKEVKDLLNN